MYRLPKSNPRLPRVIISEQTQDILNNKPKLRYVYDIQVFDDEEGRYAGLFAFETGDGEVDDKVQPNSEQYLAAILQKGGPNSIEFQALNTINRGTRLAKLNFDFDHEQYLFPLGLVAEANRELSRK